MYSAASLAGSALAAAAAGMQAGYSQWLVIWLGLVCQWATAH